MKLLRLDLLAFGAFTDQTLDFGGEAGLHLVYGSNEAGKSTTLRALRGLLYGIPNDTPDGFLHPFTKMRVGGLIEHGEERHELVRRKGNKNTLLDPAGEPVDEQVLTSALAGVSANVFQTMFGIDHDELVRGGHAITQGAGDLGQILFAAGAGIADLQAVQRTLEGDAEKLFTPRGKRTINLLLSQIDAVRKAMKEASLPSRQWVETQENLQAAEQRLAAVEARVAEASRESNRLERIRDALPLVAPWRKAREQAAAMNGVCVLPADFAERRRKLAERRAVADSELARTNENLATLEARLAELDVPRELIDRADEIEQLREALGSYREAQGDLPGLEARQQQSRREAERMLASLRPGMPLDEADTLRLARSQQTEISRLGKQQESLLAEQRRAKAELGELRAQLELTSAELAQQAEAPSPRRLQETIERQQKQGDLCARHAALEAQCSAAAKQAEVELQRLRRWTGTLESLEALAIPPSETIDQFEQELTSLAEQAARVATKREEQQRERADCEREIAQLQLEGNVVTEDDLQAARNEREALWQRLLEAWQSGGTSGPQKQLFDTEAASRGQSTAAYQRAVVNADQVADRLRREAHRVAKLAQFIAAQQACDRELEQLQQAGAVAEQAQTDALARWQALWAPLGVEAGTPREMRSWCERQRQLCVAIRTLREERAELARLEQLINAGELDLQRAMEELSMAAPADASLTELFVQARAAVQRLDADAARREQLAKEVQQTRSRLAVSEARASEADSRLTQWREEWARVIAPLGLPPDASPLQADDLLAQISDLFQKLTDISDKSERIEGIGERSRRFLARVRQLVERCAPDLVELPPEAALEQLFARLRAAQADQQRLATLTQSVQQERERNKKAQQVIDAAGAAQRVLCEEAACDSPDALVEAERASQEAVRVRNELASYESQLRLLSGAEPIEAFVELAEATPRDELPHRIEQLRQTAEQLAAERNTLNQNIGSLRSALAAMNGNGTSAEYRQNLHAMLAQLEGEVEQYARLRLAATVLRHAVERYRDQNEGPVLRLAGEYFTKLTLGSFSGLRAEYQNSDKPILVGVRADGAQTAPVQAMSEGTADQLYLSLRLAGLQTFLASHEPAPLVVDDILVNFDDERSIAALQVLAEVARSSQVIFFTHHRHLLQLAREHLSPDAWRLHQLSSKETPALAPPPASSRRPATRRKRSPAVTED